MLRLNSRIARAVGLLAALAQSGSCHAAEGFDIRDHGAKGDGMTLDTAAIQRALDAAGAAGGGRVRVPAGRYLTGTVHLRSHVTLELEAGARLIGTTNLAAYHEPKVPAALPEARWGKWHRALLLGENLRDIAITGAGTIDGNRVFDPTGEEQMRGPHALVLVNCENIRIRDVTFLDAANYAILFFVTDHVDIHNVTCLGGWDGVHWRGGPERWCRNVRITNCRFFTGDDAIAGRYWENTLISGCVINSSCNGIRLIGPARDLAIVDNLFRGPGERPHLTSRERQRTNMLSGVILQPGAWDKTEGTLHDVVVANNTMLNVASPVTLWTKPGNPVGRVTVQGLNATGVYRAALSAESWGGSPIGEVVFRNVTVEFAGGGTAEEGSREVKPPGVDARSLPAWGVFARNVTLLTLEDVRLALAKDDFRPAIVADSVTTLKLDNVRLPAVAGVAEAIVTTNVSKVLK
ncbi:MAG TPA: glycosyl hydrolase family 28-related protein [Verrucomicrobiae bacterium]